MIAAYFGVGLAFYLWRCYVEAHTFKNAPFQGVVLGFLFGVMLWPLAMVYVWRNK